MYSPARAAEQSASNSPRCAILAEGESRRLAGVLGGRPKPTVRLLGLSLVERVISACSEAGIHRFVVVLGFQASRVVAISKGLSAWNAAAAAAWSGTLTRRTRSPGISPGYVPS